MNEIMKFVKETVNFDTSKLGLSIYGMIGVACSAIASAYGGWSDCMNTLLIFMAIDYVTGIITAGLFHASNKSETGGLESRAGWKGLCRKGVTMLIVLVAARIDLTFGTGTLARDAVCYGFISMEAISIIENAGLMGLPLPKAVTNMIDLLKKKADESAEEIK